MQNRSQPPPPDPLPGVPSGTPFGTTSDPLESLPALHLPLPRGSVIGILGGGQLGRMLAQAAAQLGYQCHIYSDEPDAPAFQVAKTHTIASKSDTTALARFAQAVDVITFEFENIPSEVLTFLQNACSCRDDTTGLAEFRHDIRPEIRTKTQPENQSEVQSEAQSKLRPETRTGTKFKSDFATRIAPSHISLAISQDRLQEKRFFTQTGCPCAPFFSIDTAQDIAPALREFERRNLGPQAILKTRRLGYDGKGQHVVSVADAQDSSGTLAGVFAKIGTRPAVLEACVPFAMEISVVLARAANGDTCVYDIPRNRHENGILVESSVPAVLPDTLVETAVDIAARIAKELNHVGVLAVEMFVVSDTNWLQKAGFAPPGGQGSGGALLVNEIAPRVHNSGHFTLDACTTSQFENHIRAICALPLGSTVRHSDVVMRNVLGAEILERDKLCDPPGSCWHDYGKSEIRKGRKMGHVTYLTPLLQAAPECL